MAANSTNTNIFDAMAAPLSGFALDTIGSYNPITSWFTTTLSQVGFVNIQEMKSDDPDLEKRIISEIGSYGKQLCRVVAALQAICEHLGPLNPERWEPDERAAVNSFLRLAEEISSFKCANQPVRKWEVDQIISAIRDLKRLDRGSYEQVQEGLAKG
jgi:hypothetical protein